MPKAIICSAACGHLNRCCQFDDGTRQLAEITCKDALEKHGYLDMEDLQFEAEFLTWNQASQNSFAFARHLTSTLGIRVSWDPFNPDWIASAANIDLAQAMINTQHLIHVQFKNEQKWAKVVEVTAEGKLVTKRTDEGDIFMTKTEGQDTTTGYPTLRETTQRTFPRLLQLTEPDRICSTEDIKKGKRKIGWAQAMYPLRARLQELKVINFSPEKWDDTLEDPLTELKSGEQVFMAIRPKLIGAGYTTLDSIPRIQKGSGTRFNCPALKGVDSKTQESATRWILLLDKYPAHLHALDIKDAQKQRDPGIEPLEGMTTSQLADKYIVKRNKIRNQCTLLRGQVEDGVVLYLDKVEETIRACDNLLLTWKTHGSPLVDRKVKETMYRMISKTIDELEQWRDNSSTGDTLTSLTSIETSLEEIEGMDSAILTEEEDAATEFPSILKLIKKIKIAGNNPQIRQWWYEVMTSRPPLLPKNEEKYREEILDRMEESWQKEEWAIIMPQMVNEILQKILTTTRTPTATRTSHATEGIKWIRMEELGKALTNRCRTVQELKNKKQKMQGWTTDRHTNSEQFEFECQLKTPTRGHIHELLNLGESSSHNFFQLLITNQDLLRLREDMWPSHKTQRKGWWCRAFATAINRQCPTCNRLWNTEQISPSLTHVAL